MDAPKTAWLEVQVDVDSISLSLLTEGQNGARVEETAMYHLDQLADSAGAIDTLNLSDESQERLNEQARLAAIGQIFEQSEDEPDLPEVGDVVEDENPPSWSVDGWLEVVEVMADVRCDEYVIQGFHEGEVVDERKQFNTDKTVADANPSYDADEPVVMAQYEGTGDWYAFPASRLN
jgi:hypothetical protein